ncbi:IS200/IS605 family transposase [Ancylomarina longa]|uniref:IS200/IS605 family transposase n=1 Tax=Ancylomarina longa TaxID=2487017 RepID=A0A434AER2_9BACT|nr:IS200/IS605 family transposase [Ancylomarina longa]RUT72815.1 IS200/IS605 family transposase [Ancylomarina longa]
MPYLKIYIHFVWSTKYREPFLESSLLRKKVWQHIKDNANEKGIHIDFISGYKDHCHCLISFNAHQTVKDVMHLIKGESSYWINKNKYCKYQFQWQDDYYAVSVGKSELSRVRNYIKNQETHHQTQSFQLEEDQLIEKYGFVKMNDHEDPVVKTTGN